MAEATDGFAPIVAEGVRGKSRQLDAITLAYRFAPRRRRNGLAEQKVAALLPAGIPVINPDVTAAEAIADLRRLPRWQYLPLLVVAPVMGLVFAVRGPAAFFDADMVVDDLPTTRDAEEEADHPINHALTDRRDAMLLDALGKIHADRGDEPITVAVVYGAGHIPAVAAGLRDRYGYRPREAEWLTQWWIATRAPDGRASVADTQPETWRQSLTVNVAAAAELTRAALPALRRSRGHVVFVNASPGLRDEI